VPVAVVQDGDRVLVHGGGRWRLFDAGGARVADGGYGASSVVLDAANGLFYAMNTADYVADFRLADGTPAFHTAPSFGETFVRPYLARRGARLLVAGVDTEGGTHRPTPPRTAVLEFIEVGEPLEVDGTGLLFSVTGAAQLVVDSNRLTTALAGDRVVFATKNLLGWATTDLQVERTFSGDFEPLQLSADEAGRVHLVVRTPAGAALWVVSPEGKRTAEVALPAEYRELLAPPIVGYDHRIFLVTRARVQALDAAGRKLFEGELPASAVGAAVTADDLLLVCAGAELYAYGPDGRHRTVWSSPGGPLATAPVVTADGRVLVADRRSLYSLAP